MKRTTGFLLLFCFLAIPANALLLMRTYGTITVAPYIHGFDNSEKLYPGYRSEFTSNIDFFRYKKFVFSSLIGNTLIINDPDTSSVRLDRIRYTLTPGFRVEFNHWLLRGAIHHECIHRIASSETSGSTWWNSIQLGIGTKEAYFLYLRDEYKNVNNVFLNDIDARIDFGYIIPAENTVFTGQNHDYRYEMFSLLRYHIAVFNNVAYFMTLRQNMWMKSDDSFEHQINLTLNAFRKGTKNFAGLFYNYTLFDSFSLDNSNHMGSLGFRILF